MASFILTTLQEVVATLDPRDAKGNPSKLFGMPGWAVSDPTILTLTVAADGMSAKVASTGKVGTCQLSVKAEGDPTPGVDPLTAAQQIDVTAAEATSLGINLGTPALIPPALLP